MRPFLAALLVVSCGSGSSPAFVPVSVEMQDSYVGGPERYLLFVTATKKLNPACASNCEMAVAIEDGGCNTITVHADGGVICESGGGMWFPFAGMTSGGAELHTSPPREVAVGADLAVSVLPDGEPSCRTTLAVPESGLIISAVRTGNTCSFSSRRP